MRRRRQVLQVSTFPFLAVLLCAMGSLILLLLVIDRRAKAVARAKALEAAARMEKEEQRAASTRLAESEKQEQARRADMQNQKMQLEKQIQQIDTETCTAGQELSTEQCRAADLQNGIREESTRVAQKQAENQHRTGKVGQMQAKARETSQELSDLSANLLQLEQTMAKIKTAKQQEPQVYSVVPYLGRRGANRRPFYVECTDTALVFHPDPRTLESADMTPEKIRTEVENRVAKLRARGNAQEETPYLLMLVRPGGISSYYRAMTALDGLKVDFGYELIEADWILDFPEKDKPPVQPWMVTEKPPDNRPPLPLPASKSLSANSDSIKPIGSGQAMTSGDAKAQVQRGDGIQEPMQTGNNTPVSLPGRISPE